MKIAIINAYGYKNIGDEAILESALHFISQHTTAKDAIAIHSESVSSIPPAISKKYGLKVFQLPYGYAIRSKKKKVGLSIKIIRFVEIFSFSFFYIVMDYFQMKSLPRTGFYSYLKSLKDADAIIGMGGGYFLSRNSLSDSFGLYLSLIPLWVSKWFKKKILFLPISFGPFASSMHSKATYNALKDTTVISRDAITLETIKSHDTNNKLRTLFVPDLALFYNVSATVDIKKKRNSAYIILTAREWLPNTKQILFEKSLASCIDTLWETKGLKTIFIPMASNSIEDDDHRVAKRIQSYLKRTDIFSVSASNEPKEVQTLLKDAYMALCTRLHSAILATTVYTPFITMAYTSKTHGFMNYFNIKKWNINMEDVSFNNLQEKIKELANEHTYNQFIQNLSIKRKEIQMYEKIVHQELKNVLFV